MPLRERHLLGIEDLDLDEIELILNTSRSFKEISTRSIKKVPTLRGKSLINLFYEPKLPPSAWARIPSTSIFPPAV